MELPDFMKYSNKFTQKDFVEKISRIAKRAGSKLPNSSMPRSSSIIHSRATK